MAQIRTLLCVSTLALITGVVEAGAQGSNSPDHYALTVSVDEVSLTFHAADAHGLPINNLRLDEIHVLDNGKPPGKILSFQSQQNLPLRAGILLDSSPSMSEHLRTSRTIALEYAQKLLLQQADQAFVMDFGYVSKITQTWTNKPAELTAGIASAGNVNPLPGTAILDSLFRTCSYQFGEIGPGTSRNFILLFSDGEDNASHSSLKDVVGACQRTNTAIYAFRAESKPAFFSSGPGMLEELTSQSGGRVFYDDASQAEIYRDLLVVEADLRDQYRLVYKPADLKSDGSFRHVELLGPERATSIRVRAGYYAPNR